MQYYIKVALEHFAFGLVIPISISWKLANGLSIAEAAFTEALILLITALFEIPSGVLADKIGNKKTLLIGSLLQLIAMIFMTIGGSLEMFIVSAVFSGIGWACISGADEAYIYDDFLEDKRRYKRFFANVTIVDEAATVGGMLFSSALLWLTAGFRWPFIVASALLLAHALYVIFVLPGEAPKTSLSPISNLQSIRKAVLKKTVVLLPLLIALAFVFESGRVLWQPHMEAIGLSIASFGLLFTVFKLASIGGSFFAKHRNFSRSDLIIIFVVMISTLALFSVSNVIVSVIALTLFLATENYFRIYMSSVLNEAITSNRATVLSIASSVRNIIGSGLVFGLGLVASSSIQFALILLAIIKIPAVLYLLFRYHQIKTTPPLLPDDVN